MMTSVTYVETSKLNRRLGEVLELVERGDEVLLTRYGKVVARITRADVPGDGNEGPARAGADGGTEEQAGAAAATRSAPATARPKVHKLTRDEILNRVNQRGRK